MPQTPGGVLPHQPKLDRVRVACRRAHGRAVALLADRLFDGVLRYVRIKRQGSGEARIFPWGGSVVSKYFTNACKALEIPDLHFHDCRHEAASSLIEAGWSTAEVRMITGHKSSSMLDRYVNLDPADLHAKVVPISKAKKAG
jgi:integrase